MCGVHFVVPTIFFFLKNLIPWCYVEKLLNSVCKTKRMRAIKIRSFVLYREWNEQYYFCLSLEISQSRSYVPHGILKLVILKMVWIKQCCRKLWTNRHHPNTAVSLCYLLGLRVLPFEVLEVDSRNWLLRLHYPYLAQASSCFLVHLIIHKATFWHHYDSTIIPFCVRIEYSLPMTQKRDLTPKALV